MSYSNLNLFTGAKNLLVNCAQMKEGDKVLILHEDPALGWYDLEAPQAVANCAEKMGGSADLVQVAGPTNEEDKSFLEQIAPYDIIVFFARIGDQHRFCDRSKGKTCVMSYIRNAEMLASPYGRLHHQAMLDVKEAVNEVLLRANKIEITCPLGTKYKGYTSERFKKSAGDVELKRFPMGVHLPIDASHFAGEVVIANYLTPTGSKVYEPAAVAIEEPVVATLEGNEILTLQGKEDVVDKIEDHYWRVSQFLDVDPAYVHSWHAGIHPGISYDQHAADDPDRWSNTVFTSPRFLHIHTCGAYAPGEICLMVHNPSVSIDGKALWKEGRLQIASHKKLKDCVAAWPELRILYADDDIFDGLSVQ